MHYFFKPSRVYKNRWFITKFEPDRNEPKGAYCIIGTVCTCPAYKPECKHIRMLEEWKELEPDKKLGAYYDDKTKEWCKSPFHGMLDQMMQEEEPNDGSV